MPRDAEAEAALHAEINSCRAERRTAGKAFARLKPKTSLVLSEKRGVCLSHKKWHNLLKKVFQFINDKQNDKKELGTRHNERNLPRTWGKRTWKLTALCPLSPSLLFSLLKKEFF